MWTKYHALNIVGTWGLFNLVNYDHKIFIAHSTGLFVLFSYLWMHFVVFDRDLKGFSQYMRDLMLLTMFEWDWRDQIRFIVNCLLLVCFSNLIKSFTRKGIFKQNGTRLNGNEILLNGIGGIGNSNLTHAWQWVLLKALFFYFLKFLFTFWFLFLSRFCPCNFWINGTFQMLYF